LIRETIASISKESVFRHFCRQDIILGK